jgi:protein TonB
MAYRTPLQTSRWKAMLAALVVTGILGFGVITGLNVEMIGRAVDHLRTIEISLPKPPPPELPRPKPKPKPKQEGAPAAPKASPVVAPKPEVQLPTRQVIAAAAQPGTGASSANGQGGAGTGTGAGGTGSGLGGGGGGGNTPARLVRNLSRSDYSRLAGGRMPAGSAGLAIRFNAAGRVDSCSVEHSSGDPVIDAGLCPLVAARLLFDPARNAQGRPIAFYTHYLARWRR